MLKVTIAIAISQLSGQVSCEVLQVTESILMSAALKLWCSGDRNFIHTCIPAWGHKKSYNS